MTVIKNVNIVEESGKLQRCTIGIQDECIAYISDCSSNTCKQQSIIIDAKGCIAIPGMIDVHCHVREPGFTYKENFRSASLAASAGGVTAFFDMPNTNPATTTLSALEEKRKLAKTSVIDYGLHFGASDATNSAEIKKSRTPICPPSVKIFLNESTGNLMMKNQNLLEEVVECSWFICAHAEEEQVERIISLAQRYQTPLYLCHISRKSEVDYIRSVRRHFTETSSPLYVEVCPHHLLFNRGAQKRNPLLNMKPSLQGREDQEALWEALLDNEVDCIASDHAPHTLEEKRHMLVEGKDIFGVPGLESSLLFLLDTVNKGTLSLAKVVSLTAGNPSKIFGISRKGSLAKGNHADIVLINMRDGKTEFQNETVISKSGWSILHSRTLNASIEATLSRGALLYSTHAMVENIRNCDFSAKLHESERGVFFFHQGRELSCHVR